jgi:DNA-directed RNA polymerase subunit RPC12/RpoP
VCGAWKATPSKSSYVYCDYCASLIDWDFKAALASGNPLPGPTYEALIAKLKPELEAAKAAGDRARYMEAQRKMFDAFAEACPASHSPRIKDPGYRKAFVDYTAESATLGDFDPNCAALMDRQTAESQKIQWSVSGKGMLAESQSFWRMFRAVEARMNAAIEMNERTGIIARHPDKPTREVLKKIGLSAMVQGWLQYLSPEDQTRLLTETALGGDYSHVPAPPTTAWRCSSCGSESRVVAGARKIECGGCGRVGDVGGSEVPCASCGAKVALAPGAVLLACPYCRAELRAMR